MAVGAGGSRSPSEGQDKLRGPLLVFDLVGPMAHFRKFYTNSSSLSYPLPPRTVLMGLIAALLGLDRDSYYEKLSMEQAHLGVALKTPVRSLMQTVNYLFTKNEGWDGTQGHTQIPVEFILPQPSERFLRYRIYFAHIDPMLIEKLAEQLSQGEYAYPPYLGLTECLAWVENARLYPPDEVEWVRDPNGPLPLQTALLQCRIRGLPPLTELAGRRLLKDRMPLDFYPGRRVKAVKDILWEAEGRPLPLKVCGLVFRAPGEDAYGTFLEP